MTWGGKPTFPSAQYLCHNAKVVHVFEAQVLRKSPGSEIEITCDTQFSIAHAAPPYVSLPAVSLYGLCQGGVSIGDRSAHLFSFVSFFVRSESPFLRPDLHLACRWRAQKLSRLAVAPTLSDKLRRCQATP